MILYSNNCPRCKILKTQLEDADIPFEVSSDFKKVIDAGLRTAPVLEVNGQMLTFDMAIKYILVERGLSL